MLEHRTGQYMSDNFAKHFQVSARLGNWKDKIVCGTIDGGVAGGMTRRYEGTVTYIQKEENLNLLFKYGVALYTTLIRHCFSKNSHKLLW